MTTNEALISVSAIAVCTFLTRVIPFIVFPNNKPVPEYVKYLGTVLPFAVTGLLIIYCLKSVSISVYPFGLPEAIAICFVVAVHKWKHKLLLSVLGGTVLYMLLVQVVFS